MPDEESGDTADDVVVDGPEATEEREGAASAVDNFGRANGNVADPSVVAAATGAVGRRDDEEWRGGRDEEGTREWKEETLWGDGEEITEADVGWAEAVE